MAISKRNVITYGLSGSLGELLVFRQRAGRTVIASRPRKTAKSATPAMVLARARFARAVAYAKACVKDPIKKAAYQAKAKAGQTAFNVAITDFQCPPEIEEMPDLRSYEGVPGNIITVSVIDDFIVSTVLVQIISQETTVLEEGYAVQDHNQLDWNYTVTAFNHSLKGSRIIFRAKDLPGNDTILSITL